MSDGTYASPASLYALGDRTPSLPDDGDFWIAPGAHVIGDVVLKSGASIWFGAALRGDNETITIGENSNVQENCVFHTDPGSPLTVGANCTIGHKAMLHGCVIGDGTLIGMSATVLNDVVIGKNCLIGAGALITQGTHIPDGSLVIGAPGRVKGPLSAEQVAGLARSAERYREKMREFRMDLKTIK